MPNPMISPPIAALMNQQINAGNQLPNNLVGHALQLQPFVGAFNVGQGNCVALFDNGGRICAYVDYGLPLPANRNTLPVPYNNLQAADVPCICSDPVMVLTHWDYDHLAMVEKNPQARALRWIVPQQAIGSNTARLLYARVLMQIIGQLHANVNAGQRAGLFLWPLGLGGVALPHRLWTPWGFLERGTGTGNDPNDNGIIASVCVADYDGSTSAWNNALDGHDPQRPAAQLYHLPDVVDETNLPVTQAAQNQATQAILQFARQRYRDQVVQGLRGWVAQAFPQATALQVATYVDQNLRQLLQQLAQQLPNSPLNQQVARLLTVLNRVAALLQTLGNNEIVQLAGAGLANANIQDTGNNQRFILLPGDNSLFEMPSLKTFNPPRYVGLVAVHHGASSWLQRTYDRSMALVEEVFASGRQYLMNDGAQMRELTMTPAPPAPGFRGWPTQNPYFPAPAADPLPGVNGAIGGGRIVYSSGIGPAPGYRRPYGHPKDGAVLSYLQRGWSSRLDTAIPDWRGAEFYFPGWGGGQAPILAPIPYRRDNAALGWQPDGNPGGAAMTYLWRDACAVQPPQGNWQVVLPGNAGAPLQRFCHGAIHGNNGRTYRFYY